MSADNIVIDKFNRPMHSLRISVTDRCNFRCSYCMPKEVFHPQYQYLSRSHILSLEEIVRFAQISYSLGVRKFRLTGGEPLIRRNLEFLIEHLALLGADVDISLTTNGALLTKAKTLALKKAGLQRITISLDAIDDDLFQKMNDMSFPIKNVLRGIDHAIHADLSPIKVNMVVMKGTNEQQILPMVHYFMERPVTLRFIEFMDVGNSNDWKMDQVYTAEEIVNTLQSQFSIKPLSAHHKGEVAKRWLIENEQGIHNEVGIISSISQPFCQDCDRMRLSANGHLYTCLFAQNGFDIKTVLREHSDDDQVIVTLKNIWNKREDRYSELRSQQKVNLPKLEMSYIGG